MNFIIIFKIWFADLLKYLTKRLSETTSHDQCEQVLISELNELGLTLTYDLQLRD